MDQSPTAGVDLASFARPILNNLPERTDRLADSLAELTWAVGRPMVERDVHLIRPARFSDAGGFASPGYRSNLDAHLRAARWAWDTGQERVLVLEDDVAFGPGWSTWGAGLLRRLLDRPWHLASLGYLDEWGEAPTRPDDPLPGSVTSSCPGGAGWARFAGRVNGAHAYVLHHTVIDEWIAHLEMVRGGVPGDDLRGPMPSDGAVNTFFWINPERIRLVAVPNLAGTRPTRSGIDPGRIDRLPIVADLADLAEAARRWRRHRRRSATINYR